MALQLTSQMAVAIVLTRISRIVLPGRIGGTARSNVAVSDLIPVIFDDHHRRGGVLDEPVTIPPPPCTHQGVDHRLVIFSICVFPAW